MTKYVLASAKVDAHELTEKNIEQLADDFGGTVHTSVRAEGSRFATFESEDGTLRVNIGGFLVTRDGVVVDGFSDPKAFHEAYERP